jgi:hypothetical protein
MSADVCFRACSLTNPACTAPSYCHLRHLWLHQIFRHYIINGMIFGKEVLKITRVFVCVATTFVSNISHSVKNSARYCHKTENVIL